MKYKILAIDDEKEVLNLLRDVFQLEGFLVYTANNGEEALQKIGMGPDIILLDVNMPGINGFDVCKKIRAFVSCPIIFLTAKVQEEDRIRGLMVGGDDYIIKPFSIDELNARVKAHLRREERKIIKEEVKFLRDIVLSYSERKVFYLEKEISFTKTEFDIIEILSMHSGQVFTKEKIYEKLWGYDKEGNSSIITEHIRRIRTKFSKYTEDTIIETTWGVGYKWIG